MIKAAAFLLAGGGTIGVALFDLFAHYADRVTILARIRRLLADGPEAESDMSAAAFWLELALMLPIGIFIMLLGLAELGI